MGEDLLFLHPFDCLVIEEGPAFAVRGLNVDNVMSFAHRSPFVDHYRLKAVMGSRLLSPEWLAFLKVQGLRIRRSVGHFLSFHGYPVDLEDECGFVAISLREVPCLTVA